MMTCRRCGRTRVDADMGVINGEAYCHPAASVEETCYMVTDAGLLDVSDIIRGGMIRSPRPYPFEEGVCVIPINDEGREVLREALDRQP